MRRLEARCLLIVALILPALVQAQQCQLVRIAEWEVNLQGGLPIIEGAINGKKIGVLLDTGAFATLVTKDSASRLGLGTRGARAEGVVGFGGESDVHVAVIDELVIGGSTRNNLRVRVSGERPIRGVDFILGDDFFRTMDMEFDYGKRVVRLFQPRNCRDSPLAYWDRNAPFVEMDDGAMIVIPVSINGRAARALIDSGASSSMVSLPFAGRVGVTTDSAGVAPSTCTTGLGAGVVQSWVAPFEAIAIGSEVMRNVRVQMGAFMPEVARTHPEMVLGTDFLRTHRVMVSRSQRRVYFTYTGGQVFPATPALGCDERVLGKSAKEAIAVYDEAIKSNPADATALVARALLRLRSNDAKGARADLDAALALQPTNAVALAARMDARMRQRDWAGALEDSNAAVMYGMRTADMYESRSALRVAMREEALAISEADEALKLDPRHEGALRGRAALLMRAGKYEAAERDFAAMTWTYAPLWASLARARRGVDGNPALEEGVARMKPDQWPAPIMLHLLGRIDRGALMAAAASDAKARKGQECEADFYVGARLAAEAKTSEGRRLLEKARDECPRDFIEYGEALEALARLGP